MSGTSADGIDVAIVKFSGSPDDLKEISLIGCDTFEYSENTKKLIINCRNLSVDEISLLNARIAYEFANAVTSLERRLKITADLVASHGQTVYHHSGVGDKTTLQLGAGSILSSKLKRPVIYDFRQKDIALGGQGAPLTPVTDYYLYSNKNNFDKRVDAILNLGGIANITVFGDTVDKVIGFDTGPANAPLDRIVRIITNNKSNFDENGDLARSGTIDIELLEKIIALDSYLGKVPPKSSGFETYGDVFIENIKTLNHGVVDINLLATVTKFVSHTISWSINNFVKSNILNLAVVGGGAKNKFLIELLQKDLSSVKILTGDTVGIDIDSRESTAFAFLGYCFIKGFALNCQSVTGASEPGILGCLAI